ncbi:MAG: PaaI family thioesterase [Alphaproteobacteria bacterium]
MTFYDTFQDMTASGDFSQLHEALPYSKFMGITLSEEAGRIVTTMAYDDKLIGNTSLPALHGGTLAALLELAALFQIAHEIETEKMPKVITLTVDYMRSGGPKDTFASARATRVGRRVANVVATAWQDNPEKPVASANVNFLLA